MKRPMLDVRSKEELRAHASRLAASYTPEWRQDGPGDDPGTAILDLFCDMYYQSIQRWNMVPEKLYLEFLKEIGCQEPGPSPSQGTMRFTPHETVREPVGVAAGTQVFTPDEEGGNVVFETTRAIQATAAHLTDIYYTNPDRDEILRLDRVRPQRFFAREGEGVQKHVLGLGQGEALLLDCPGEITLHPCCEAEYQEEEAVTRLTCEGLRWYYLSGGEPVPFDAVRGEKNKIVLEKTNRLPIDGEPGGADGPMTRCVYCAGRPREDVTLESVLVSSVPSAACRASTLFSGDVPMDREAGDYCFSRRPGLYSLFYLRSDTALSKRRARGLLRLELTFVVDAPPAVEPAIAYGQAIIDRQGAVTPKPDDVYISGVVWEYYNGLGWKNLEVQGNKNPFGAREAGQGALELTFQIPGDLREIEVNAEPGLYIRARVTEIENLYSQYQRWIVPYVKEACFSWQYDASPQADWAWCENNGTRREIPGADRVTAWHLPALRVMEPGEESMYFRFDRSPHAMPLSMRFSLDGRTRMSEETVWEARTARGYTAVQSVDETENLLHSGEQFLYLPSPLPETELFGQSGYWLRLRRTSFQPSAAPVVRSVELNTVSAAQVQRRPVQAFDTGLYEVCKSVRVQNTPVQSCRVWVDELSALTEDEAREMSREGRGRVRLEERGRQVTRCWVLWERWMDLALAGAEERGYALDPWSGEIRFGDGRHGRVPPQGDGNIQVEYATTRGASGNVPVGVVDAPLGGLPRISTLGNVTAMSGGTGRLDLESMEARGSRRLRHRGRACGRQDYEDLVRELFPQVRHVRCFVGRDEKGGEAPGHVTVALTGYGEQGEGLERLCHGVYGELSRRGSCCLTAEGRLHVCPAVELTVNVEASIELERVENAAETQQAVTRRLDSLIEGVWGSRPIGEQIRMSEVWTAVRETENVRSIRQILAEGAWDEGGVPRLSPLDYRNDFPYAVVKNGRHTVTLV